MGGARTADLSVAEVRILNEEWLVNRCSGSVVVHLLGSNFRLLTKCVTHLICVDANKKLIYDSMERYPMKLSKGAIRTFVGDGSIIEKVYALEVVRISSASNVGMRLTKSSAQKRRQKRVKKHAEKRRWSFRRIIVWWRICLLFALRL